VRTTYDVYRHVNKTKYNIYIIEDNTFRNKTNKGGNQTEENRVVMDANNFISQHAVTTDEDKHAAVRTVCSKM
jgi:hypothetical protein